jgi:hypothetical protein
MAVPKRNRQSILWIRCFRLLKCLHLHHNWEHKNRVSVCWICFYHSDKTVSNHSLCVISRVSQEDIESCRVWMISFGSAWRNSAWQATVRSWFTQPFFQSAALHGRLRSFRDRSPWYLTELQLQFSFVFQVLNRFSSLGHMGSILITKLLKIKIEWNKIKNILFFCRSWGLPRL